MLVKSEKSGFKRTVQTSSTQTQSLATTKPLREVHRRHEEMPDKYYFADQYKNNNNWRAHYDTTGVEILKQTAGHVTHFVAGVGTGGTITGVGHRLKEHNPDIQVCGIVPDEFPGIEGLKPMGRPEDIVPEILDESIIDKKISVTIDHAYDMCSLSSEARMVCWSILRRILARCL